MLVYTSKVARLVSHRSLIDIQEDHLTASWVPAGIITSYFP